MVVTVQTYPLYSWPDNIQVDERTGDLFVASHPVAYRFFAYTDDVGSLHSPSQVTRKSLTGKEAVPHR